MMRDTDQARTSASIAQELEILIGPLWFDDFSSEGEQPMIVFVSSSPMQALDVDAFGTLIGAAKLTDFTDRVPTALAELAGYQKKIGEYVEVSAAFVRLMTSLSSLIGVVDASTTEPKKAAYVVGLAPDGVVVGVQTGVIWT